MHQARALHHAEHARRVAGGYPVRAQRQIDAGVEQPAHRAESRTELEVGECVVDHRAARLPHQGDVVVGEPDAVRDGGVAVEQAEVVHVLDQGLAVELAAGDCLHLRFEDMGVEGQPVRAGELIGRVHQGHGAALRTGGRRHEAEPSGPVVIEGERLLTERGELVCRRRHHLVDLALEVARQKVVQIDDRVGQLAVDHVTGDRGAQAHILVGLEHRADSLHGLQREFENVVGEEGRAGLDRVHGAERRAQVNHARGKLDGAEDAVGERHPELQRHVVVASLGEGLRRVDVAVDEAGDHQLALAGNHPFGLGVGCGLADSGDALAFDQDVALERLAPALRVHRDNGGTLNQYRHALPSPVPDRPAENLFQNNECAGHREHHAAVPAAARMSPKASSPSCPLAIAAELAYLPTVTARNSSPRVTGEEKCCNSGSCSAIRAGTSPSTST